MGWKQFISWIFYLFILNDFTRSALSMWDKDLAHHKLGWLILSKQSDKLSFYWNNCDLSLLQRLFKLITYQKYSKNKFTLYKV